MRDRARALAEQQPHGVFVLLDLLLNLRNLRSCRVEQLFRLAYVGERRIAAPFQGARQIH